MSVDSFSRKVFNNKAQFFFQMEKSISGQLFRGNGLVRLYVILRTLISVEVSVRAKGKLPETQSGDFI